MRTSSAYICGVARNCAQYLPAVLTNMLQIASLLLDCKIIIVVAADSIKDIKLLTEFACQHSTTVILYIDNATMSPIRTVNIARARNICLKIMRDLNKQKQKRHPFPYFIMMDCDDVCCAPINKELLATIFADACPQWDALSFNCDPYYDIWALSAPPFIFSYSNFAGGKIKWYRHLQRMLAAAATAKTQLIPVWSAFGGFAIYKTDPFLTHSDILYDGTYRMDYIPSSLLSQNIRSAGGPIYCQQTTITPLIEPGADCEHRYFHLTAVLKHGARIFIHREPIFNVYSHQGEISSPFIPATIL